MSDTKKMWHCKVCGHKQDMKKNICEECGADLVLYGMVDADTSTPPPPPPSPWRRIVIIAVIALLTSAVAGFLIWKFLPSMAGHDDKVDPTSRVSDGVPGASVEPTPFVSDSVPSASAKPSEPTPAEPAAAPDFLAFANGYAQEDTGKRKDSTDENAYYGRTYTMSSTGADKIAEEYLALLEANYDFQQIGSDTLGESSAYYWFRYTGAAVVSEFSLNITLTAGGAVVDSVRVENANLLIHVWPEENGTSVEVVPAREIELRDDGYRTTYVESATLPDFAAFADGYAIEVQTTGGTTHIGYSLNMTTDAAKQTFEEYLELLERSYPYREIGREVFRWEEVQSDRVLYWFSYTGSANVTTKTSYMSYDDLRINYNDAALVVEIAHLDSGDWDIFFFYYIAPEIEFVDDGYRTSYTAH